MTELMTTEYPPVPYVSQIDNAPTRNDCGPACGLMLARWLGQGLHDTVAQWSNKIDIDQDGTTSLDLANMFRQLGITPTLGSDQPYPFIELVTYGKLPIKNPAFNTATFLHWIVRLSATSYHDPLRSGTAGANLQSTEAAIDAAIYSKSYRIGVRERPEPMTTYKARVEYDRVIHIAPQSIMPAEFLVITNAAFAAKQSITFSWDDAALPIDGLKSRTLIGWNILPGDRQNYINFVNTYYPAPAIVTTFEWRNTANPVNPNPPTRDPAITASRVVGVHELGNAGKAKESLQRGAKAVMVFEDALGAAQMSIAYPDAIVMHRKYFTYAFTPQEALAQHGIDINNPNPSQSRAWYRGLNENDVSGYDSSPAGILKRAAWDLECARLLKRAAPYAVWVAGGWAHGNPDFTRQDVCDAMRQGYAAAYNSGDIVFDLHNYSKSNPNNPKDYKYYAPIWFERRWQFLFEKCGFNPAVKGIVASESGIEAGAGGFRWAQFSQDEFRAWCSYALQVQAQPLIINGVSYPSPYLCGTIFQYGNNYQGSGGWYGYGLDEYMGVLESAWKDGLPVPKSFELLNMHAGETMPEDYMPEPKDLSHPSN